MKGSEVLVLGVAYKKDIDDMRECPALEIMDLLAQKGANVAYHDPYCPEIKEDGHTPAGAVGKSVALTDEALAGADAVMIVTDHSDIDYACGEGSGEGAGRHSGGGDAVQAAGAARGSHDRCEGSSGRS